jgi:hypothetical protein
MEDQISATVLATKAWLILKDTDPKNELLKWMESENISEDDFKNHFWDKEEPWQNFAGSMVTMRVETNYFLAVKKELKEKFNIEI